MGTIREDPAVHQAMRPSGNPMDAHGGATVEEMHDRDFTFVALDHP